MYPIINIFGKHIGTYDLFALIGGMLSIIYACKKAKNKKLNNFISFLLVCIIGALIGSHLLFGLINFNSFVSFITKLNKINDIGLIFKNFICWQQKRQML